MASKWPDPCPHGLPGTFSAGRSRPGCRGPSEEMARAIVPRHDAVIAVPAVRHRSLCGHRHRRHVLPPALRPVPGPLGAVAGGGAGRGGADLLARRVAAVAGRRRGREPGPGARRAPAPGRGLARPRRPSRRRGRLLRHGPPRWRTPRRDAGDAHRGHGRLCPAPAVGPGGRLRLGQRPDPDLRHADVPSDVGAALRLLVGRMARRHHPAGGHRRARSCSP
jgi:hypothetical protein